jgi:hypothetical protein
MCQLRPNVFTEVAERERVLLGLAGAAAAVNTATATATATAAPDVAIGAAVPATGRIEAH